MDAASIALCRDNRMPDSRLQPPRPREHPARRHRASRSAAPWTPAKADRINRPGEGGESHAADCRDPEGNRTPHARCSIDALKAELKHLRTGRASVGLLEGVLVEYYGTPTPLNQVANLSTPDATLHPDPALGGPALPGHREGDPDERPRPEPGVRRPRRARARPLPDGGATQGDRQEGPPLRGAGEGRDPPPSPRGQRQGQEGRRRPPRSRPTTRSALSTRSRR